MNPVSGYSVASHPVAGEGVGSRWSPPVQSLVSATLVIPTIPLWYLRLVPSDRGWDQMLAGIWTLVLTLVLDVYLVVLVTIFARTSRRRVAALVTAIVAAVVDVADTAMVIFAPISEGLGWADRVLVVVSFVLSVAAWGIARRRQSSWVIGLALSFLIGIGLVALYQSDWLYDNFPDFSGGWIFFWVLWVGGFLLCCLICWGIDVLASAAGSKKVSRP
jgi:hypothetical protein